MSIIDKYLNVLTETEINWNKVKDAAVNASEDIFGEPNDSTINSMINKVKNDGKAKDTEDAIQIVINMMRSK